MGTSFIYAVCSKRESFQIGRDHEIIDILISKLPPTLSDLLHGVQQIHSIEYLCDNFTTWVEDYAMQYPTQSDDIQQFFANLPQFLDENPDWVRSVFFEWNRYIILHLFECSILPTLSR